ncbi:hypothetical protein [Pantoea dispersa]|uniref:hypothetical protein n=1 Tax=Pantoea dispersa TaxID=59814 RepID=UPI001EE733EA|nr:hypothetical protein [Pantoea dispersa]UKY36456.1 hypothetical protein KFZ74_19630 [Pantoea dispersa]
MNLTPAQFLEKHIISELTRQGFASNVTNIGAREALKFYRRAGSCEGKNKMFDECLSVAKAWAVKSQGKKKMIPRCALNLRVLPTGYPVHEAAAPRKTADFCIFIVAAAGLLTQ